MSKPEGHSESWESMLKEMINKFPKCAEPPTSLVRSYYVPSPQEHVNIQNLITANERSVRTLESAITDLRSAISILESQLSDCSKLTEFQSSLLSPIRKLPDEVLGHIFSFACENGTIDIGSKARGTIWDIQEVCFRWRNVAQHTPSIWCNFELARVSYSDKAPKNLKSTIIGRIQSCLKNSRALPLNISLRPRVFSSVPGGALADIVNHSDRLESLTTSGTGIDQLYESTAYIPKPELPLLRSLTVKYETETPGSFCVFKQATALRLVSLTDCILPDIQDFPWNSIEALELIECTMPNERNAKSIFESMTALQELSWTSNWCEEQPTQPILLPSLKVLSVINNGHEYFDEEDGLPPRHLLLFNAPQLETVYIYGDISQLQDLVSIVRNSGDSFTNLVLHGNSSDFIIEAIAEFSSVEELTLHDIPGPECDIILQELIQVSNSDNTQLLPSLRQLNLPDLTDLPTSTVSLLLELILRRSPLLPAPASQGQVATTGRLSYVSIAEFLEFDYYGKELRMIVDGQVRHRIPIDAQSFPSLLSSVDTSV